MHASHSLHGPSSAGARLARGEQAFFWKFSEQMAISLIIAARAFSLACARSDRICVRIAKMPNSSVLSRITLTASCSHLDRMAGALGWSLTAERKFLNQPAFAAFFSLLPRFVPPAPDPSGQSLSESSESCGSRGRTLPTSLSPCCLFRFRTLSRLPRAISPRPDDAWLRRTALLNSVLPADGVMVSFETSCSSRSSGVSAGIGEASVMAGLDSAPESSEYKRSSTRFWGVVKAGLRNAGADGLRCSSGLKNEAWGGRGWPWGLRGELFGASAKAKGFGFVDRSFDGELNVAVGKEARSAVLPDRPRGHDEPEGGCAELLQVA